MIASYGPLDALFDFQRALESRLESDWLRGATAGTGAFPPINVFQQGDNLVVILEQTPRQDVQIDPEDFAVTLDQGGGRYGATPLWMAASDGNALTQADPGWLPLFDPSTVTFGTPLVTPGGDISR